MRRRTGMRRIELAALIDDLSFCAVPLTFKRIEQDSVLGTAVASGFLWREGEDWFLVTNWHNVTGINPLTLEHLGGFTPSHVTLSLKFEISRATDSRLIGVKDYTVPLYGHGGPLWLEHPSGPNVDCVALMFKIPPDTGLATKPLNDHPFDDFYSPSVGDDCFILGYPKGLRGAGSTPLWKRGSIASEPNLGVNGEPIVLIDSATRKGMSGSPVIARHSGVYLNGLSLNDKSVLGTVQCFLGIYSGRTDDDELGLQIGRVWKSTVVTETIQRGRRGKDPLDLVYPQPTAPAPN